MPPPPPMGVQNNNALLTPKDFAPLFFKALQGQDKPVCLKFGNTLPTYVVASSAEGSPTAFDSLNPASPVKIKLDLSSQFPLFQVILSPSTDARPSELVFDFEGYSYEYTAHQRRIRQGVWQALYGSTPAISSTSSADSFGTREILGIALRRLHSGQHTSKANHQLHLPEDLKSLAVSLQTAKSLIMVTHNMSAVLHSALQYLDKLVQERSEWVPHGYPKPDYPLRLF